MGKKDTGRQKFIFGSIFIISNKLKTIEAVSGATVTSKAYLKAIENALSK